MDKPQSLKTHFVPYSFDDSNPAYKAICAEREAAGIRLMRGYASYGVTSGLTQTKMGPAREIFLDTQFVFGDQWNTPPDAYSKVGWRVHNWFEEIQPGQHDRTGHYLHITDEMRELCRLTHKCGYCEVDYYGLEHAGQFCDACFGSEYLKTDDLHLLRLLPLSIAGSVGVNRLPLTEAEKAVLVPAYVRRQISAADERASALAAKARIKVAEKYTQALITAQTEHDGYVWLLDRNINVKNVLYYPHTNKFCFGWLHTLAEEVKVELRKLLVTFPYEYEFKGEGEADEQR